MHLERGDIFLTRSRSWLGRAIRWATREPREEATMVNHVGGIVTDGDARYAVAIEALKKVRRHSLWEKYARTSTDVAVFRPVGLSDEQIATFVWHLEDNVGRTYGYAKILLHLARRWGPARRVIDWASPLALDNYPICSYLVARAYEEAGVDFGVSAGLATPDDIWDHVTESGDWSMVCPLEPLA